MKKLQGKVAFEGKIKTGEEIVIRYPTKEDLKQMWEYINTLSQEKTFIRFQGEKISLEDEEKYLNSFLEKISQRKAVKLLVICEGKIVGISDITMKDLAQKHIGVFGITVAKNFRGQGIGKILMELTLKEAKKNLLQLEITILDVFGSNALAKKMYQKFGFVEYGRLPKGLKLAKGYADDVLMYKIV